jgi:hypothetical protein
VDFSQLKTFQTVLFDEFDEMEIRTPDCLATLKLVREPKARRKRDPQHNRGRKSGMPASVGGDTG